jgi:hypothetical protein
MRSPWPKLLAVGPCLALSYGLAFGSAQPSGAPKELWDGDVIEHYVVSECIYGMPYCVDYHELDSTSCAQAPDTTRKERAKAGMRVRISLCAYAGDTTRTPCFQDERLVTLGDGGLPIALEYVILRAATLDGAWELWALRPVLTGVTGACAADSGRVRVVFSLHDAPGAKPDRDSLYSVTRQAIDELERRDLSHAATSLERVLARNPKSPLYRCLYAEALAQLGRCDDYARQCAIVARENHFTPTLTHACEVGYCDGWNHDDRGRAAVIAEALKRGERSECLAWLWMSTIENSASMISDPAARRQYLDEQEHLVRQTGWKHRALDMALEWIQKARVASDHD